MKLARCARSDSHSVRALRAVNSRPCGAGLHSNGRGAAPVLTCVVHFSNAHPFCFPFWIRRCGRRHISKTFCAFCVGANATHMYKVCWSGPTSFAHLSRMPVEVVCRRFRGSLVCDDYTHVVRRQAHFNWVYFSLRGRKCDADWEVCWSGPTYFAYLHRMLVEILRRRFAAPLGFSFYFICYGPIYDVIRLHPIKQVCIPCVSRLFIYFFYKKKNAARHTAGR